ncbi:MAG: DUF3343 domain-containing protein [Clostridia bacterium]|nr:DUF3343 domain-containing protein [Clostridia bacterium]
MTILAVFRSRAQTLDFLSAVKAIGVPAQAVATPKEAGVGCGISAKFDSAFLERAKRVLARRPYSSFSGFLQTDANGGYYYGGA